MYDKKKQITKITRGIAKAVRLNKEVYVHDLGYYTNDALVLAGAIKNHFERISNGKYLPDIVINDSKVEIIISIRY